MNDRSMADNKAVLMKPKIWSIALITMLGFAFYQLYRYNLFLDDDYLFYTFTGTNRPIHSLADALQSQWQAYTTWNGRFLIHTIVQMFCSIWGVKAFAVFNTLVFLLFYLLMFKFTVYGRQHFLIAGFLLLFLMWVFIPIQGITFLGNIAFSVNYLWGSVAILYFLFLYQRSTLDRISVWKSVILLAFGLVIGSLQESFSVGIAGSLLLYYCFHRKELKGDRFFLVLGFWLGTLILILAPGNFHRMESEQVSLLDKGWKCLLLVKWSQFKNMLFEIPILDVLLAALVLMFIKNRSDALQFIKKQQVFLVAIVINFVFALVIAYKGQWQMTSSILMALILLMNLGLKKWEKWFYRYRVVLVLVPGFFLAITYVSAFSIRRDLYKAHTILVDSARRTTNGIVFADYEVLGHIYQQRYAFMENYFRVVFYMGDTYHKRLLSTYLSNGKNPNLVTCVLPFSPDVAASFCTKENQLDRTMPVFKAGAKPFYIISASSDASLQLLVDRINSLRGNALCKVKLDGLGCEKFRYNGRLYAVIYHR